MEIKIKLENGVWFVNDKSYNDLNVKEKQFFLEFLIAMRLVKDPNELLVNYKII